MTKPLNLMHIVFCLDVGGLEYLVLNLIKKLNKAKYNVSICSLSAKGKLEEKFIKMGIKVYHIEKSRGIDYLLYFKLASLLRKNQIDIIHTHNPAPWFYGVVAGKLAGIKAAVHTEHSYLFAEQKRLMLAERLLSKITETIVSDSDKVTDFLVKKLGIHEERITTIVNGIDIDKFKIVVDVMAKKTEFGIAEDSLVIGNVARLEPVKNHLYLLDVFSKVIRSFPKAVLVIVGGGSQFEILKLKAVELGIKNKVFFLGVRDDIPELLGLFDIFALTSINEGISLSLLEAMAAGRPIVATNVGGNPDVVVDGKTGFLLPLKDSEKMAEKIVSLLSNKELSIRMGEAGLKRAEQLFSLDRMVKNYENIYDHCFEKRTNS